MKATYGWASFFRGDGSGPGAFATATTLDYPKKEDLIPNHFSKGLRLKQTSHIGIRLEKDELLHNDCDNLKLSNPTNDKYTTEMYR